MFLALEAFGTAQERKLETLDLKLVAADGDEEDHDSIVVSGIGS